MISKEQLADAKNFRWQMKIISLFGWIMCVIILIGILGFEFVAEDKKLEGIITMCGLCGFLGMFGGLIYLGMDTKIKEYEALQEIINKD